MIQCLPWSQVEADISSTLENAWNTRYVPANTRYDPPIVDDSMVRRMGPPRSTLAGTTSTRRCKQASNSRADGMMEPVLFLKCSKFK
jgi:hypothetical protein